jgi:serralysin
MAGEYPNSIPFTTGFSALTSAQVAEVQRALALISSYTGLNFTQVTETPATLGTPATPSTPATPGTPAIRGDIRLANASSSVVPTATAWFPGSAVNSGDVFFGSTGRNPLIGNFDSSAAVLHEIGHALGLKHGEENTQPFGALPSNQLSQEYSVMNYSSYIGQPQPPGPATVAPGSWPQTYMMDDIAALQYLYGANFGRVGQDVTYTWSPTRSSSTAWVRAFPSKTQRHHLPPGKSSSPSGPRVRTAPMT